MTYAWACLAREESVLYEHKLREYETRAYRKCSEPGYSHMPVVMIIPIICNVAPQTDGDNIVPVAVEGPLASQSSVCEPILRALPDWFGMEAGIVQYAKDIDHLPTFIARVGSEVIGFLTLKLHNAFAAEVYVMGVRTEWHRRGAGRLLICKAKEYVAQHDIHYLQVKTLGSSHPDLFYARTRVFYFAMGFRPLEEFPQIWDAQNPCLIMVQYLEESDAD
jgi:GNAT superfamily N-acetyltransferase